MRTNPNYVLGINLEETIRNFDITCGGEFFYELNKPALDLSLIKRAKNLKQNIIDLIWFLYEKGKATLFDIDMAMQEENVELGGGSVSICNILALLKNKRVISEQYPYRLTRQHRDALDYVFLSKM